MKVLTILLALPAAHALGINCRGSGVCPLSGFENTANEGVLQGLRDALYYANVSPSTTYSNGEHIICVSTKIGIDIGLAKGLLSLSVHGSVEVGGICAFGQDLKQPLTLASIRKLADALLQHGCKVCGSVPVHFVDQGNNDPGQGILTFNFVSNDACTGNCLGRAIGSGSGGSGSGGNGSGGSGSGGGGSGGSGSGGSGSGGNTPVTVVNTVTIANTPKTVTLAPQTITKTPAVVSPTTDLDDDSTTSQTAATAPTTPGTSSTAVQTSAGPATVTVRTGAVEKGAVATSLWYLSLQFMLAWL